MHATRRNACLWFVRALYAIAIVAAAVWCVDKVSESTLYGSTEAVLVLIGLTCLGGGAAIGFVVTWLISRTKS